MRSGPSAPILCLGITPCLQRTLLFSKLRPGEVNRATRVIETASGKGTNVARVIHLLGGNPHLATLAGGDTGKRFEALLRADGISSARIASGSPTRICQTLIDESSGTVTELVEESGPLPPDEMEALRREVSRCLTYCRVLVISGSPPPGTPPTLYRDFVQQAQSLACRVIIDTQKRPLTEALPARPWLVKLNQEELGISLGKEIHTPEATRDAAMALMEQGAQNVVVTQGARAVWGFGPQGTLHFTPPKIRPLNPIGSGDSMAAGLALGIARGDSLMESLRLGIACGAANALSLTSGVVDPGTVQELRPRVKAGDGGPPG